MGQFLPTFLDLKKAFDALIICFLVHKKIIGQMNGRRINIVIGNYSFTLVITAITESVSEYLSGIVHSHYGKYS